MFNRNHDTIYHLNKNFLCNSLLTVKFVQSLDTNWKWDISYFNCFFSINSFRYLLWSYVFPILILLNFVYWQWYCCVLLNLYFILVVSCVSIIFYYLLLLFVSLSDFFYWGVFWILGRVEEKNSFELPVI